MRRNILMPGVVLLSLSLILSGAAAAQTPTTGQISGVVYDPSGAAVAGATVTLTSEAGVKREVTSDSAGRYAFPLIPPGRYRLQARASGFEEASYEGVVSRITAITDFDIHLTVAGRKEAVVVTTEVPLVQTEAAARGQVIPSETLRQLPLPTRNFQQLLTLTAGTLSSIPNSSDLGRGDTVFNVNGQRSLSNAVVINGVDANSIGTGSTPNLSVPASDSLQEFIVQTSQYDASQGRNAGSIVAAVTRSGSNQFHGNLYYFLRNDALNANNFFLNANDIPRPEYRRHQFGGTLGGPLKTDKAWFFLSYQGTRERNGTSQTHSLAGVFVPQNLSNDRSTATLSALAAAWGVPVIHPTALAVLQLVLPDGSFAVPSAPNPAPCGAPLPACTSVFRPVSGLSKFTEDQFNGNLDLQLSAGNRLSGKFFWANNPAVQALFNSFGIGNALPLPGFGADVDFKQRLVSVADTHLFSAGLLNEARFGYSRITTRSVPQEPFTSAQVGITSPLSSLFPGMPTISVSNFFDVGSSPFADNDAQVWTYTLGDTVTWRKGRHTIKMGAEYKYHAVDLRFDLYTRGNVFHLGFSGNPFRDFLGGFFGLNGLSIMGSGVNNRSNRSWDFSGFFTDDWRFSDRFTLTFGVRYEYFAPFTEGNGRYIGFDPALQQTVVIPPQPGFTTSPGVAITGGFVQAGNADTPLPGIPTVRDSLVEPDKNNFGPRIGFAWQPFGHTNQFVIRGGYGFYFDRPNARLYNNQILNFPYYTLAQVFTAPIATPFVQVPAPSAFPLLFNNAATFPQGGPPALLPAVVAASACAPAGFTCVGANGLYPDIHNFRMPYVQQWSLGIQYEFIRNWLIDLSYVGSAGRKLHRLAALNQGLAAGGSGLLSPGLSALAAQGFGVHVVQSSAVSSYNSLQATLTKRFTYGLDFILAYTYGHSLDDYSGDGSGTSDNSVVPGDQRPTHFRNYASSDFDRRHRLVFSGIYTVPKLYKGDAGFAKQVLNDWQFGAIITVQSGTPFSILTNANAFVQARANFAGTCTADSATLRGSVHSRLSRYFDTSCFAAASGVGAFGNTGRNILRGPDQRNIDFSVIKFFPVTESQRFEFRAEFFNLTNTPSFANPVNIRASANFGQIVRTSTGPRVVQFAFKYNF
jgi:hypothetical protein